MQLYSSNRGALQFEMNSAPISSYDWSSVQIFASPHGLDKGLFERTQFATVRIPGRMIIRLNYFLPFCIFNMKSIRGDGVGSDKSKTSLPRQKALNIVRHTQFLSTSRGTLTLYLNYIC
jgi:hypothetical protein